MQPENTVIVRPKVIDDVLINPGIGFMTFQRFNGDKNNEGKSWTEGFPIEYQEFTGSLENENHPMTSIAYFRIYWRYLEPEKGDYRWELIDKALETARQRKQTLMLRIAPYGHKDDNTDVPDWYRNMVGEEKPSYGQWRVDPENPIYVEHFGGLIRAAGKRYDGHPNLESVDLAFVGPWGEGAGSDLLSHNTMTALVDAYIDSFKETHLLTMLIEGDSNKYALTRGNFGYRADCLGDMRDRWCHMFDLYPRQIIEAGVQDAWKKAPVSFEVCWVVQHWKDMGWDIDYIIDQSIKWHISSFNTKSSPIPEEWLPNVDRWLKKMGYRLDLRRFTYPETIKPGGRLTFTSWWENLGVAPCYRKFPLAFRLKNEKTSRVLTTSADIREWLPGDSLYDDFVAVPADMPAGDYELQVGILDRYSFEPGVKLAIEGLQPDGWYHLGKITVE